MKRQIVNIVNFVRALEPRNPKIDLFDTVKRQVELMQRHHLRGTFLFQYDVLVLPEYMEYFKTLDAQQFEFGVWHEIVQEQVELLGLPWRGRWPWDFHTHCGFPVGYEKEVRERLIDQLYGAFHKQFGYYPRVFGSWLFDSHTVRYIADTYGCDALCNCKEQFGTDGYTMWGGYYGQAYYPRRQNIFLPARDDGERIDAPLFRMLGSDQVYQYDFRMDVNRDCAAVQGVITLEPSCLPGIGGNDEGWINWFLRENYNGECLTFGYAQAGQENPFGWERIKHGLSIQCRRFEQEQEKGTITVEPLGETGRWFKSTYRDTPPSAITAHTAYDDEEKNSVWYSTKTYRINLYGDHGTFRVRDVHLFTADFPDIYDNGICTRHFAVYEALPFIDGNRYTGKGVLAGGYVRYEDGTEPMHSEMVFTDEGEGRATVRYGDLTVRLFEDGFELEGRTPFVFENRIGIHGEHMPEVREVSDGLVRLAYGGVEYTLRLTRGRVLSHDRFASDGCTLAFLFERT